MRILLVPPDTRPPTLELPTQLAQMCGAEVLTPPKEALPYFFTPADTEALKNWLLTNAKAANSLVICLESLCLGGMIPARRVPSSLEAVLERLELLNELKRLHPNLDIYAFGVVVRVAHDNDPHEEKPYYGEWGKQLRAYSTAYDRHARHGTSEKEALIAAENALPKDILQDWLSTRRRNHAMHIKAMEMLASGVLTHLCLTLDDTSEYGLASVDRRTVEGLADKLGIWQRFDTYPGADEVPCALITRAIRQGKPKAKAWVRYSGSLGAASGMAYEDRPAGELVRAHLRAAGCTLAESPSEANFILAVNTPGKRQAHFQPDFASVDTPDRHLASFLDDMQSDLELSRRVTLADIAYPNGADLRLWHMLQNFPLAHLAGYSAWNTAGNTLGAAVAFGALSELVTDKTKQQEAIFTRMVDDALYQSVVRPLLRKHLSSPSPFDLGEQLPEAEAKLQELITPYIQDLWQAHFASEGAALLLGKPHLAWPRLFTGVFPISLKT